LSGLNVDPARPPNGKRPFPLLPDMAEKTEIVGVAIDNETDFPA